MTIREKNITDPKPFTGSVYIDIFYTWINTYVISHWSHKIPQTHVCCYTLFVYDALFCIRHEQEKQRGRNRKDLENTKRWVTGSGWCFVWWMWALLKGLSLPHLLQLALENESWSRDNNKRDSLFLSNLDHWNSLRDFHMTQLLI